MNSFNYLRILFLAIFSLSIISCTNNNEDDDLGSKSPIPDKGYKKLVQMNIKGKSEDRSYFYYDKYGSLTSLEYCYYTTNGSLGSRDILNFKYENNYILISMNGEEFEKLYEIIDGKITKFIYPKINVFLTYDNNGRLATTYLEDNSGKREFTWEDGKLVNTTESHVSYYTDPYTNSHSESHTTTTCKYTYSSHGPNRCNGFFPGDNFLANYSAVYELCTVPWIIGMEQQDLPQKIEEEIIYSSGLRQLYISEFTYTFYDNGYLKTCTEKRTYIFNGYSKEETIIQEYFWQ